MSDFRVQFIEGAIPASTLAADVAVPNIDVFTNAFLIPAISPQQTAGIGRATGGIATDTLANATAKALLVDVDTITFTDASTDAFDNKVGLHVLEYAAGTGGPNEVKVRAVLSFGGTGGTIDSGPISGITDITRCVPFVFQSGTLNSGAWTSHAGTAEVINTGGNNIVRVTKVNATNQMNIVAYVVEFTGSNWTIQKVNHNFSASNTNEDAAISSVGDVTTAFTYTTFKPSQNLPVDNLFYVWLTSTTNLRHRLRGSVSGTPATTTYIIKNPQLVVTVIGADPDGTADLNAGGAAPETRDIAISTLPDYTKCIVLGYAGSNDGAAATRTSAMTLFNLTSNTNLRLRRSANVGNTEYKIQIIDFSGLISGVITDVDPITDGSNFTVRGSGFGSSPVVKINGVTQTAVGNGSTTVTVLAVLGDNRYGQDYTLTVDFSGGFSLTAPAQVQILPAAGKNYVDLSPPLAPTANRLTTSADLDGTEQIEYSLAIGGGISDVLVYSDAAFSLSPGITQFSFRAHDGVSWGTIAVQIVSAPVVPKTKALSCPVPEDL